MPATLTEKQWLSFSAYPRLLNHLRREHKIGRTNAGRRKARLYACACCRLVWNHLSEPLRELVQIAERIADDRITVAEIEEARKLLPRGPLGVGPEGDMRIAVMYAAFEDAVKDMAVVAQSIGRAQTTRGEPAGSSQIANIIREIFGNPFQPLELPTDCLSWREGTIPKLAQAIYDDQDYTPLPVVADALEEAGCQDATILDHCRQPAKHVRGCWVVDLLLGKDYRKT